MLPQTTTTHQVADKLVQTTCPYCGVGCGVDVVQSGGMTGILSELKGSAEHPANYGRLCIKGTHLLETLDGNKRLLKPVVFGQQASWDEATSIIAARMKSIVEQHGPDAVAIYGSGQRHGKSSPEPAPAWPAQQLPGELIARARRRRGLFVADRPSVSL